MNQMVAPQSQWKEGVVISIIPVASPIYGMVDLPQEIFYQPLREFSKVCTLVTVTDDFGCEGVYNLIVDGPTKVEYQVTNLIDQSCVGDNGSSNDGEVVVEIVGGLPPYTVNWIDLNNPFSANSTTSDLLTITNLTASDWEIQINDFSGCLGAFDLSSLYPNPFTIDDGIQVTAQINTNNTFLTDTIECFGASNAMASVLNANPSFEYDWHLQGSAQLLMKERLLTNYLQVIFKLPLRICLAYVLPHRLL